MDDAARRAASALLQETLRHEIPLSRAMGVSVERYDGRALTLRAPLAENINHKDTAFAGSLNALVTLCGWGMLWLIVHEAGENAKIIIQQSEIAYRAPVAHDFTAVCARPDEAQVERFVAMLRARGKARIALAAHVASASAAPIVAVEFTGRYIAHRPGAFA